MMHPALIAAQIAALVAAPPHANFHASRPLMATRRSASRLNANEIQESAESLPKAADLVAASESADKAPPTKSGFMGTGVPSIFPMLTALSVVAWYLTIALGSMSGPIVGGVKLVYAGAIAGIISRSCCAPLEMVSTVMMCRGNECMSMTDEYAST